MHEGLIRMPNSSKVYSPNGVELCKDRKKQIHVKQLSLIWVSPQLKTSSFFERDHYSNLQAHILYILVKYGN